MLQLMAVIDMNVPGQFTECSPFIHVSTFINHGDHMKQCIKTPSLFPYGRYDGCSQQFAQLAFIQAIATLLEFIIHVQGNDHAHIHVDELCG